MFVVRVQPVNVAGDGSMLVLLCWAEGHALAITSEMKAESAHSAHCNAAALVIIPLLPFPSL